MSGYSYEIAHWTASEAIKKDFGITKDAVEVMRSKTSLPVFAGISVETSEAFFMLTWESTETHKAFMNSPDYKPFTASFPPFMPEGGAKVEMAHTHFDRDPLPAWSAPVTEHAWMTPNPGEKDAVLKIVKAMVDELAKHPELATGAAVGTIEEKPEQLLIVIGWNSLEDHKKAVASDGPILKFLAEGIPKMAEKPVVIHVPYARQA